MAGEKKGADGTVEITGKPNPNSGKVWMYGGEEKRPFAHVEYQARRPG